MPRYIGYNFTGTANTSVTKSLRDPNAVDSNFANTVLLLHGDGTNTGNNNTFLDSSSNAFTITRNGNATQGTFSPFSKADGRWGSYFDGTGDYLEGTNTATLNFGSGNWTVEAWVYLFTTASFNNIVHQATDSVDGWLVDINTSGNARIVSDAGGTWGVDVTGSTTLSTNTWYHLAFVRNGSDWRIYVNGVSDGSATISDSIPDSSANFQIGSLSSLSRYFSGYISNLRVVKGTAVYTGAFTPSTTPLTNITNTSLLTCQSNRFKDNSSNDFTITSNGNVAINPFSPFADTTNYSAATKGGSGYFDGTGDYLTAAGDTAFAFGTGDFTVELWLYASVSQSDKALVGNRNTGGNTFWLIKYGAQYGNPDSISIHTGSTEIFNDIGTIAPATWNHIAWVRSSATNYLYINGTLASSTGTGGAFDFSATTTMYVGKDGYTGQAGDFNGYITNVRLVKGTAVYTSNFTPPTAPLTDISNTGLLLNFTNGQIIDSTAINVLESRINTTTATISTSQSKFGGASIYFDGNANIPIPANPVFNFGSSEFTIEFWMRTSHGADSMGILGSSNESAWTTDGWSLFYNNGNLEFNSNGTQRNSTASGTLHDNNWHHVVLSRNGSNTFEWHVDGVSKGTFAWTMNFGNATFRQSIGSYEPSNDGTFTRMTGYLDDIRWTKGIKRYTGTFTPPTRALDEVEPALVSTVDTKYNSGIWSISDSSGEENSIFTRRKQGNWLTSSRDDPPISIEYLVVGGGAGGGGGYAGGGGGSGGVSTGTINYASSLIGTAITVTVGAGGGGGPPTTTGTNGTGSVFDTVSRNGGGGGGGFQKDGASVTLASGGGGGANNGPGPKSGGTGVYNGGAAANNPSTYFGAGGGGGSTSNGNVGGGNGIGGAGGAGTNSSIKGSPNLYAGGGGGGASNAAGAGQAGGGNGGVAAGAGSAATVNTGSGGGGGGGNWSAQFGAGGNGGSGVVIIRVLTSDYSGVTTGSPTVTTDGAYTVLQYNSSGTYTL